LLKDITKYLCHNVKGFLSTFFLKIFGWIKSVKHNVNIYNASFRLSLNNFFSYKKHFIKKYLYTINHKKIALNYFYFCLWSGLSGALLALFIRLELAHPGSPFFKGNSLTYIQTITSHGLIMVFFVVVPLIFGFLGNFLIPYHIGSKDVAYPRLNSIGFWVLPSGFIVVCKSAFLRPRLWKTHEKSEKYINFYKLDDSVISSNSSLSNYEILKLQKGFYSENSISKNFSVETLRSLWWEIIKFPENLWHISENINSIQRQKLYITKSIDGNTTTSGWTFITPYTSNIKYSNVGPIDCLILGVIFAGISTTISFTNLLVTRRTLSMPGLKNRRFLLPFLTIAILLALRILVLITPVLAGCMIMIFTDRHWGTSFFDFAYGGDPILSQHLFWFFGHPEVYVLVIPSFGVINIVLPYSNYRRVASKQHMVWAIYVMGYMGFLVWGHHMYLVGLDHRSRTLYSTVTIMISLPATIKIVSWTLSMLNSPVQANPITISSLSYILFFLVSGLTGMWLSHVSLNVSMHDTFYVVAHFHLMLSATTVLGIFIAVYYYFTAIFNIELSSTFVWAHIINFTVGHWLTFIPQFFAGVAGMPRRIHDYPEVFSGWNGLSTSGYIITLLGILSFFLVLLDSHIKAKIPKDTLITPRINNQLNYLIFKLESIHLHQFNFTKVAL